MPSCERCWRDAGMADTGDKVKEYHRLLIERESSPCTLEERAGEDAQVCPTCQRKTVHQHAHVCLKCGWRPTTETRC